MDWIKVKTGHILFEYTDLSDSEFRAWIKLMAMVSNLEHEPTREQMLRQCHHKTLDSLQEKLKRRSITLQDIFKKVLIDVQRVVKGKELNKERQQRFREHRDNITRDITVMSRRREDKIREDNNNTPLPPKIKKAQKTEIPDWVPIDAFNRYQESRTRKLKPVSYKGFFEKLERLAKASGTTPDAILKQSIDNGWQGIFELKDGGSNGKFGKGNANDGPRVQPKEYTPEPPPDVSPEGKAKVDRLIAGLAAKWKTPDSPAE